VPAYQLRATRSIPELEIHAGDILIYDPADAVEPVTVHRVVAIDPGAILNQFVSGALDPIDVSPPDFFAVACGRPSKSRRNGLRLLSRG
jgi:hypothetical protein